MSPKQKLLYALATVAEEGGEISQVAGKALRFGWHDERRAKMVEELTDVLVACELLGVHPDPGRRKMKLKKHAQYTK